MKIKVCLRYAREPELVALRFNPGIYMPGLAKQALRAQLEGQDFQIHMQKDVDYVQKPLAFYLTLDEAEDQDIIYSLRSQYAPVSAFIRNALIRCIRGKVDFIYSDLHLKEMARQHETEENKPQDPIQTFMERNGMTTSQPRATMTRSELTQEEENISEKEEDALLRAALELAKS